MTGQILVPREYAEQGRAARHPAKVALAARLMGLPEPPADACMARLPNGTEVDLEASSIGDLLAVAPDEGSLARVLETALEASPSPRARRRWAEVATSRWAALKLQPEADLRALVEIAALITALRGRRVVAA